MNQKYNLFAQNAPEQVSQELSDFANRLIAEENLRLLDGVNVEYENLKDSDGTPKKGICRLIYNREEEIGIAKLGKVRKRLAEIDFKINRPYRGHFIEKTYGHASRFEFQKGQGYGRNLFYLILSILDEYTPATKLRGTMENGGYDEISTQMRKYFGAEEFWKKMDAKFFYLEDWLFRPPGAPWENIFRIRIKSAKRKIKAQL